jgi:endonuclease/exonuclease/phosphatase family metal-dependent hydrolase
MSNWYDGVGLPSSDKGNDGDFLLQVDTNDTWKKTDGVWVKMGNIGDPQSAEKILTLQADNKTLGENIATNKQNIANLDTAIGNNTTNITKNANNIATNTTNIAKNTTNIATNTQNIATNTTNITKNTTNINKKLNIISNFTNSSESLYDLMANYDTTISNNKNNGIFTVGTYNVKYFTSNDYQIIRKVLHKAYKNSLNFLCLQEAINGGGIDSIPCALTSNSKYTSYYFPPNIVYKNGGSYGNCIVSNTAFSSTDYSLITQAEGSSEQRYVEKVKVNFNGNTITIFNTHLSYENEIYIASDVSYLMDYVLADNSTYKIICGDFNTYNSSTLAPLTNNGFTSVNQGQFANSKIDHIFYNNRLTLVNGYQDTYDSTISDHPLIVASFKLT